MEVGEEDSLQELRHLTASIGALLDERKIVLHRRLHEVLKGALEEADNEGKPAEETDEESEEEGELVLLDSVLEKEPERDTKEEEPKIKEEAEKDDWGC